MTRRITALFAFVLTATAAFGALAQDDDARARAREQFNLGVTRYEAGSYQAALEAFQEAYRIAPHPNVRVNMANCYENLERPLEAMHHFERFLAEAENPTPQQRREVQAAIRRLERQIGNVRLSVSPDGALVSIDSAETRRAPILEPIRLTAGTHHVTVRLDGYRTEHREIDVAGGEEQRITIRLERGEDDAPAVATAEPGPTEEPGPAETDGGAATDATETADAAAVGEAEADAMPAEQGGGGWELRLTTPVIIAGSATAAFLVATAVTGGLAVAYNGDYESAVARYEAGTITEAERQSGLSAADTANTLSIVSDVFLIATIAAAGATAFFVIVEGLDAGEDELAASGFELRAAPAVGPNGGAVTLLGRF